MSTSTKTLRKLAEHSQCYLRLYPYCQQEPGNVVLAHIRRGGIAGIGQKPDDVCAIPMCHNCHSIYDARSFVGDYNRDQLDAFALVGLVQWLSWLRKQEILTVCL